MTIGETIRIEESSSVGLYLGDFKALTREQEQTLFQRLEKAEGSEKKALKDEIIKLNLRLVRYWASRIKNRYQADIQLTDLFQEGILGLISAVEKFDWRKRVKFSTYATWWIRQKIIKAIEDSDTIRIPNNTYQKSGRYRRTHEQLTRKLGRDPSPEETAAEMEVTVKKIGELRRVVTLQNISSLDAPFSEDNTLSLLDVLSVEDPSEVEEATDLSLTREVVLEILETLNPRERRILILRFGLGDDKPWTLERVGKKFNLSRERIRQIQIKALKELRENFEVQELLEGFC
ncbi:RNA polymerase sigma factor RpoD/SigA [Patescibacteria group bacterium]